MGEKNTRGKKTLVSASIAIILAILLLIILMGFPAREQQPVKPVSASPLESYTGFALKFSLMSGLGERNTAVSPFSVYPALLMLSEGASGTTRTEILSTLGLSSVTDAREWFKSSSERFLSVSDPAKTYIANSLWVREGTPIRSEYMGVLKEYYNAEEYFFSDPTSATNRINTWVYDKTQGMIDKILETLDQASIIVLVNTVYFKSNWTTPFDTTYKDVFLSPKGPVETDFLSGDVQAVTVETDEYTAVMLGYKGTSIKFVALMPKQSQLKDYMDTMTSKKLLQILEALLSGKEEKVHLAMPKFDVDSGILELRPLLQQMGIRSAFNPEQADLSAMLDTTHMTGKPFVSNVFHRARVKVDLYGTEAAAATAIVIKVTAIPLQLKTVKLDKPFAFFLVDPETKAILFAGSYVQP